jgi:hypothetical protein
VSEANMNTPIFQAHGDADYTVRGTAQHKFHFNSLQFRRHNWNKSTRCMDAAAQL